MGAIQRNLCIGQRHKYVFAVANLNPFYSGPNWWALNSRHISASLAWWVIYLFLSQVEILLRTETKFVVTSKEPAFKYALSAVIMMLAS
jgi:hypothetical protein